MLGITFKSFLIKNQIVLLHAHGNLQHRSGPKPCKYLKKLKYLN